MEALVRVQMCGSFQNQAQRLAGTLAERRGLRGDPGAVGHAELNRPPGSCGFEPRTGCPSPGSPEHTRVPSGLQALPEGWSLHLKHKGSSFCKKIFKNH